MASWWKKTLVTATNLAGLTAGTYNLLTHRPQPQKSGSIHLQGLHEAVEVITDTYGIPHIYANNEDDLCFAQGYIHAQDRLWQMELNRRIGSGRLAELFGDVALETDRFCRRLGLHRSSAEELTRIPAPILHILEKYAQGVNTFIVQNANKMPVEFTLLNFVPEPWQPADTVQWSKMIGWNLSGNWETELTRAHLVAKLGVERASKLETGYDPEHPLIIPPGVSYQGINLGLREQYEQLQELSGFGMFGGSNNWVVDGTKSETGAPILCNDPHLGQAAPSIWYECHLIAGDLDVTGASFPGAPGVILGHNQHIAWGVTNAVSDVQDLYIEKFNPENAHQYQYQGKWEEAEIIREEIKVKGQEQPHIEEVRITRHGPILSQQTLPQKEDGVVQEIPLALRWTGLEQCNIVSAVWALNHASNWSEFRVALHDWDVPAQNFVYADREGNIGYIMAGAIPIRSKGQALLPVPGWTGEYEWTGYVPFDELPQTYNPEQHFIATANNRVVDDSYPYYITHEWLNGYRAQRIRDLLTSKDKLSLADMAAIQADQYSLPAREIVPFILKMEGDTPQEKAALQILQSWDYILAPNSIAAAIYTKFFNKLQYIVINAIMGDEDETLKQSYLGIGANILAVSNGYASRDKPLLIRLMKEHDDHWFSDSVIANGPKSWDGAIKNAFKAALEELRDRLGANILRWEYGIVHKMTYTHPLGAVKVLEPFFNRGPYSVGGDVDTVNMGAALPNNPAVVITVPSYRQIVDLADWSRSRAVHAPGQSGRPGSKHYDDLIDLWRKNEHHPMYFTREVIVENAEETLQMVPSKTIGV